LICAGHDFQLILGVSQQGEAPLVWKADLLDFTGNGKRAKTGPNYPQNSL